MVAINFKTWINIIALSLKLLNEDSDLIIKSSWIELSDFEIVSHQSNQGLLIDYYTDGRDTPLKSYILIPWQDMTLKSNSDDLQLLTLDLKLVTPFAIIYEKMGSDELNRWLKVEANTIESRLLNLFSSFDCDEILNAKDNYSIFSEIQIMSQNEYSTYVEINAAKPGTGMIDHKKIKDEFAGKMILLKIFPDMGSPAIQWINAGPHELLKETQDIQGDLQKVFLDYLKGYIDQMIAYPLDTNMVLEQYRPQVDDKYLDQYKKFLYQLTHQPDIIQDYLNSIQEFPDYQPKSTPDGIFDYRPSLEDKVSELPVAELEQLNALIKEFEKYAKMAELNPGKWTEGNVVLGAKPEEYEPSDEELILDVIGSRIEQIADLNKKEVIITVAGKNATKKKLRYNHYYYIHYDVIGSGRFVYVDRIEKREIKFTE